MEQQYGGGNYYPNQPYYNNAAPAYSAPLGYQRTGNTFNSNEGYYGNVQPGIELQQPSNAYSPQHGGAPVYDAPAYDAPSGPPPKGKSDSMIR